MKKTHYMVLLLISALALSACNLIPNSNQQEKTDVEQTSQQEELVDNENKTQPNNQMNDTGETTEQDSMQTEQTYVEYSSTAIADATKNGGRVLLFFHAGWCPTCRSAEKNILENIGQVPDDLTIIKVDYDSEKDLKKKYNITYQHTFVQVDEDGEEITKWNGGEMDQILQRVK